jgi:hypothetical protein
VDTGFYQCTLCKRAFIDPNRRELLGTPVEVTTMPTEEPQGGAKQEGQVAVQLDTVQLDTIVPTQQGETNPLKEMADRAVANLTPKEKDLKEKVFHQDPFKEKVFHQDPYPTSLSQPKASPKKSSKGKKSKKTNK